ncbi:MAG: hypothetical protein AB1393_07580 [Candidatus Edwardsbacteria bacterium]
MKKRDKSPTSVRNKELKIDLFLEKRKSFILIFVLAIFILLALLLFDPKPFIGGDNATYVLLGRALLSGKGYTDIWSPGIPPHTQYPFGYPLLLCLGLVFFPHGYLPLKFISLLCGLGSVYLFYQLLKKRIRLSVLFTILLLLVLNPDILEFSHWVLSEIPFLFFSLLAVFFFDKACSQNNQKLNLYFFLGTLIMMFTYYIRTIGLAFVIGCLAYFFYKREYKRAGVLLLIFIALAISWSIRNYCIGTHGGYLDQFLMRDPYNPALGRLTLGQLTTRLFTNFQIYTFNVIPQIVLPTIGIWGLSNGGVILGLLVLAIMVIGFITGIKQRFVLPGFYTIFYLGIALLWPETWSDRRFLIPMIPFLLFYVVMGVIKILRSFLHDRSVFLTLPLLGLLVFAGLQVNISQVPISVGNLFAYVQGDKSAGYPSNWRNFFEAADWVRNNSSPEAVVVSRKPTLFYLRSEHKSFCYPFSANQDSVLKAVDKADYVMVDQVSGTTARYLIPAIQNLVPQKFEIVYVTPPPQTYILKVKK